MKRKIFCLFVFFFIENTHAEVNSNVNSESLHQLPAVTIDKYKNELLEFQKLQRDNEKLKLEEQNLALKKKLRSLGFENVNSTKVVSIFSIRNANNGLAAQIYNAYDGLKVVTQGSYVMSHYKVIKITPTVVRLRDTHEGSKEIDLNLVTLGATYGN
ncbi:hypothetical protein QUQ58_004716 [Escherichia coli]|nr:hypothetical protein [Escherichia coli]